MPQVTSDAPARSGARRRTRPALAPASRAAQALVLMTLAAGLLYITWRWTATLDGPSVWVGAPLAVAETYGILMLAAMSFSAWRLTDRPVRPPLVGRTVAVLIATFDEDEDVLRPTVIGALALRHHPTPEVWVLDDGGRPWVERMCAELGAVYLSRPAPRRHAKAGNLNHALDHVRAEFLVTLDADHVPRPELLERMLGHMADPEVAVVQGPQAFYNRGFQHPRAGDDPLRNEQSLFFDVISRGKDRHDAAFWCGCPSILRRAALDSVGGVATDTVVEDCHTSMLLAAAGWRSVYHPEVVALGLAPEEIEAFVVQRGRWARGSLQMLRRDPPFLRRGLSLVQRLEYTLSCLHFLEGPQRLVTLLVPPAVLVSGIAPINASPLLYAALFLPQLVLAPLAIFAVTGGRYRPIEGERHSIVRMEAYLRALPALVRGRGGAFKVTPKGARARASVARALRVPIAVAVVTVLALGYQSAAQVLDLPGRLSPGAHVVTVLWAFANVGMIAWVAAWAGDVQHRRRSHRFPVHVHAAYAADAAAAASRPGRLEDLSQHGAGLTVEERREPGERLRMVLLLDEGPVEVTGTVATADRLRGGTWRLGVDFDALAPGVGDAIVAWCFRHPFGPDVRVADVAPAPAAPVAAPIDGLVAAAELAATEEDVDR
jgi:cellulose synthase (UDP-forming)